MIKERANESIKEQKGEESAMFKSMPRHESFMPQHVQISKSNIKTREGHATAWPLHAAACHADLEKESIGHAAACQSIGHATACLIHAAA